MGTGLVTPEAAKLGIVTGLQLDETLWSSNACSTKVALKTPNQYSSTISQGEASFGDLAIVERLWLRYFQDPKLWWDNGDNKHHPTSADFRHRLITKKALWIDNRSTPDWVAEALEKKTLWQEAGVGSSQAGSGLQHASRTRNAVDLRLHEREAPSWAAQISEHNKSGQYRRALRIYQEMREGGVKPCSNIFLAALKACSGLHDLESCKQIHAHIVEHGLETNLTVGNMLVDVYGKCRSLTDARSFFENMPHRDVVSWNAMILGYAHMQEGEEALKLYARMQEGGMVPNNRTFVGALKACISLGVLKQGHKSNSILGKDLSLKQARLIHSDVVKGGFESDVFVGTMLIDVYVKCGSVVDARHVFENMPYRSVVSWNAMILGHAQMEECADALQLYARMQQEGVAPDDRTFVAVLKACSHLAALEEGNEVDGTPVTGQCLEQVRAIHSQIVKSGFEFDVYVGTMLVSVYAKCGNLVNAERVFEMVPRRNVFCWTAMILAYAQMEKGEDALQLYSVMQQEGLVPDDRAIVGALKACTSLAAKNEGIEVDGMTVKERCLKQVRALHSDVVRGGFESDIFVGNMLVDGYAKCGSLVDARQVFENMHIRDVVSWTIIILGYSQMEEGEEALHLYSRMQVEGVIPNDCTFVGALKACGSVGALQKGKQIHAQIREQRLEADVIVGTSLVEFYSKCGSLVDAQKAFDALPSKDVVTWNSLLYGYAKHSDAQLSIQCFEEMRQQGVKPDDATFSCLLLACSHGALVNEGLQYFRMMEGHGIAPNVYHYCSLVDLLGRSGRLDEAENMLQTIPYQNNVVGWTCLLTACRSHGDVNRGRRCFDRLIALEPENAVPYVLLGNIYANAGRWKDVDQVERWRKSAGARKKPAKAFIEVKNKVHEFTVGEERSDVSSKLRSMSTSLKEGGHVPHTQLVLKALSEKEKEEALCGHAEKLALAYGLLNTPDGTTLLVTKNLRMCNDCHSSTKIMSHLEKREIIVRDAHRVHRFVGGSCSCADRH